MTGRRRQETDWNYRYLIIVYDDQLSDACVTLTMCVCVCVCVCCSFISTAGCWATVYFFLSILSFLKSIACETGARNNSAVERLLSNAYITRLLSNAYITRLLSNAYINIYALHSSSRSNSRARNTERRIMTPLNPVKPVRPRANRALWPSLFVNCASTDSLV